MMFSVPQFIDVEDKIAGPLTWKQLLWMIGMGATILTILGIFSTVAAIVISVPVVILFMALAFYRPGGFPMSTFLFNSAFFLFRPKVAVWERPTEVAPTKKQPAAPAQASESVSGSKQLTQDKLQELAALIDSGGR